jgi:[ribosomal protein S5]-alanine N-acetyltransferase
MCAKVQRTNLPAPNLRIRPQFGAPSFTHLLMLTTRRLFLMPATPPMLEAAADDDWATLSSLLGGVSFAEGWSHFPEAIDWTRDYMREHPDELNWWMYFILHGLDGRLVGTCGYKGLPSPEGIVEIGYEIAPRYQQQGLATEAAEALVRHAWTFERVDTITAHTLGEESSSTGVLAKLGFQFIGEFYDIADGKVWAWRLERPVVV